MTERLRILLVDEDAPSRRTIAAGLTRAGDDLDVVDDGAAARRAAAARGYDLVVMDVRAAKNQGPAFCDEVRARSPAVAVVLMSAFATVDHVNAALQHGVYDYLLKPVEPQQVAALLGRVRDRLALRTRAYALRDALSVRDAFTALMGSGPSTSAVHRTVLQAAAADDPVLVVGEAGSGRSLTARTIHALSPRVERPLAVVDCAREPGRVQAELFGSATQTRGLLVSARGGVLVLESAASMPRDLRARVHEAVAQPGAPRVIAVSEGIPSVTLRRDARRTELLAWVRRFEVLLPPLRERREDIPFLVERFALLAAGPGAQPPRLAPEVMAALLDAPWPGNLRELDAVVREAVARAAGAEVIGREHLPAALASRVDHGSALVGQVEAYERAVVRRALEQAEGAVARAALDLGVPERTLRRKMRQFGIAKESFRKRSRYKHLLMQLPRS